MSGGVGSTARVQGAILLVDDDPLIRATIAESLRDGGFEVFEAGDGSAALEMLSQDPRIGVLISDIRMDVMSGPQLAEKAKDIRAGLGVIMITGHFVPRDLPYRCLRKPFGLPDLLAAIEAESA